MVSGWHRLKASNRRILLWHHRLGHGFPSDRPVAINRWVAPFVNGGWHRLKASNDQSVGGTFREWWVAPIGCDQSVGGTFLNRWVAPIEG